MFIVFHRNLRYRITLAEVPTIDLTESEISLAGSVDISFIACNKTTQTDELGATITVVLYFSTKNLEFVKY